jgi:peptide-methionine (S)-S-oxide reductase
VEVARITFDPEALSYRRVLDVFFAIHDPTSRDRQGNDVGSQYRSVIFYGDDQQRTIAEETIRELEAEGIWPAPIVTEVRPASVFYKAEDYHQEYFRNNPNQPYCAFVVAPKVRKFREKFADLRRAS